MLPYGITFLAISLSAFLNTKKTKQFSMIIFIFFILFYSLRNNIGSDWSQYEYYFDNVFDNNIVDRYKYETGYWLLNYMTSNLLGSFRYLVFLVSVFNGILFWKATNRYSKNIGIIMLLSLFYLFYPTLEAFRQSITLFLFYYSLEYIEQNEKKYILLNIVGLLFHRTGIFGLLFFVFNKYKVSKIIIMLLLLLFSLFEPYFFKIISSISPIFALRYNWYLHMEAIDNSLFSFKTLEYLFIIIFYFIFTKWKSINVREKLTLNLVLLGFILQITLGQISNIGYRMTYYTDIGIVFTYTFIYDKINEPAFKYLYIVALILYILVRFYRVFPFDDPLFIYSF